LKSIFNDGQHFLCNKSFLRVIYKESFSDINYMINPGVIHSIASAFSIHQIKNWGKERGPC